MARPERQPKQYIRIEPGYSGGKPRIAGRRIKVQDVAVWHERMGLSVDEIAFQYGLSLPEIHAALSYYFDHRDDIERDLAERDEYVEAMARNTPSLLRLAPVFERSGSRVRSPRSEAPGPQVR